MSKSPVEILGEGLIAIDPVLNSHGFQFKSGPAGNSSGGRYASGAYSNGERRLEIHFRNSLGLITYHFGELSVDHASYMEAVLGGNKGNRYPGFSDSAQVQFDDLAFDLQHFAISFLSGSFKEFAKHVGIAQASKKIQGFARIP
jgi:hypothetical protein